MTPRNWFRFENSASDPTVAEIHIIDFIGDWMDDQVNRFWGESIGVTARAFVEQLAALPSSVSALHVHINSPGGDVQGGVNIANALREQASKGRTVETFIDGIAASIASVIAMAGTKVHIADNALVMVHNPWSMAVGNAGEMRKTADVLDAIRTQIVNTYQWHSPLDVEALVALMDAETWMDADQAIANGFATDKITGFAAAASIDRRAAAALKVPDRFKARVDARLAPAPRSRNAADPDPNETPDVMVTEAIGELQQILPLLAAGSLTDLRQALGLVTEVEDELDDATEAILQLIDTQEPGAAAQANHVRRRPKAQQAASAADVLRLCREGECSAEAEALIAAGATLAQVQSRIAATRTANAAAAERRTKIVALCQVATMPELADDYVTGQMPVDAIQRQLTVITARLDNVEIDGSLSPAHAGQAEASWDRAFVRATHKFGSSSRQ